MHRNRHFRRPPALPGSGNSFPAPVAGLPRLGPVVGSLFRLCLSTNSHHCMKIPLPILPPLSWQRGRAVAAAVRGVAQQQHCHRYRPPCRRSGVSGSPITLQVQDETMHAVLTKLELQANIRFQYSRQLIGAGRRVIHPGHRPAAGRGAAPPARSAAHGLRAHQQRHYSAARRRRRRDRNRPGSG